MSIRGKLSEFTGSTGTDNFLEFKTQGRAHGRLHQLLQDPSAAWAFWLHRFWAKCGGVWEGPIYGAGDGTMSGGVADNQG